MSEISVNIVVTEGEFQKIQEFLDRTPGAETGPKETSKNENIVGENMNRKAALKAADKVENLVCMSEATCSVFTENGRKEIHKCLETIRSCLEEIRWQPIETAPKDGTEILIWVDVATVPVVHIAWYRSKEEWETSGQYCGGWETLEEWEGWWSYTTGSVSQEKLEDFKSPTHWMPLPKPPQLTKGEA